MRCFPKRAPSFGIKVGPAIICRAWWGHLKEARAAGAGPAGLMRTHIHWLAMVGNTAALNGTQFEGINVLSSSNKYALLYSTLERLQC